MNARDQVLARIRAALHDVDEQNPAADVPVDWQYGRHLGTHDVLADFVAKVRDYGATVVQVAPHELFPALTNGLEELQSERVMLPNGLPLPWKQAVADSGLRVVDDTPVLSHIELNDVDTVVTTSTVAMADSGTIALDHSEGQGRRALTLLPDKHLCVVYASQVVSDIPEALALLAPAIRSGRPVTWFSGGSATSDIELERVEGVHGPRNLYVVLVNDRS